MKVLNAVNVNTAYHKGLHYLHEFGTRRLSRAGPVLVAPEPVTTHYRQPRQRVLFSPQRDANPFFHLFEALWMLTGADDVALPKYFVARMEEFSDDKIGFHGAYGARWRGWYHYEGRDGCELEYEDQLNTLVDILRENPDDRRAILGIWDPDRDLGMKSKDVPCNVIVKFEIGVGGTCNCVEICPSERGLQCPGTQHQLNMVVFNRSNDIVWGCYGANVVQFSVLQEYLATRIGVIVGWYEQVSTNFHAYEERWRDYYPITDAHPFFDPYARPDGAVSVETLVTDVDTFDDECKLVIAHARAAPHIISDFASESLHNRFFHRVCNPMMWAYANFRAGQLKSAIDTMEQAILQSGEIDWLVAGEQWMRRRAAKRMLVGESV